jgi:hypothetical protein
MRHFAQNLFVGTLIATGIGFAFFLSQKMTDNGIDESFHDERTLSLPAIPWQGQQKSVGSPDLALQSPPNSESAQVIPNSPGLNSEDGSSRAEWPADVEGKLWNYIANSGLELLSVNSITCGHVVCEIEVVGMQTTERRVDELNEIFGGLIAHRIPAKQVKVFIKDTGSNIPVTVIWISAEPPEFIAR